MALFGSPQWQQLIAGLATKAGTTTNDDAATGNVGEYISASLSAGSATAVAPNTAVNITSISLTAGDWDVFGNGIFVANGTPTAPITTALGINTTSATLPTGPIGRSLSIDVLVTGGKDTHGQQTRVSLTATTTVYLVGFMNYVGASGGTVYGGIQARRVR